ncbi:MAG: F0F1 ATP synthase subunit epsilon [Gemmataceae bacterium]|uniref:ATP synthase epsilon chain n=1 Tax=Thermogemmata fonticola TaxID=2755323 RepID=A0A7V8VC33_9BACT|nr:F0F1 ATP synthase subunit epsilon [Thermogemmata fonticola]MBA2225296.1 F0F1 ATP synthase subunit epsilon [Thermogemmata fonticola]MCX8139606.1 F0F1 ATP synthase subunit epsilon [Gemmataceae bacterium]
MADTVPEPTVQSAVEHTLMPSEATEMEDARHDRVRVTVVTPERAVLDTSAEMVVLPLYDGEWAVLSGHAPFVARLGAGELRLKSGGAISQRWYVEFGFVQVRQDVVTLLTERAVPASEVTPALAEQARVEAASLPVGTPSERASKARARERAAGLAKVAARNTG